MLGRYGRARLGPNSRRDPFRFWHDLTQIEVQFEQAQPSLFELAAIRRVLPQFRELSPAQVREVIGRTGSLLLDEMPSPEARKLIELLGKEQLRAFGRDMSCESYLPYDRTTGCARIIEDDEIAEVSIKAMLAAGIPVVELAEFASRNDDSPQE